MDNSSQRSEGPDSPADGAQEEPGTGEVHINLPSISPFVHLGGGVQDIVRRVVGACSSVADSELSLKSHCSGASNGSDINASRYGRQDEAMYQQPERGCGPATSSIGDASMTFVQELDTQLRLAGMPSLLECPAWWLNCPEKFSNFSDCVMHSLTRHFCLRWPSFKQVPAPFTCPCIVEGCDVSFYSAEENKAWIQLAAHLAEHQRSTPLPKVRPNYVPNFDHFEYLWGNKLVESYQYKELLRSGYLGNETRPASEYNDRARERRRKGQSRQRANADEKPTRFSTVLSPRVL